MKLPTQATTSSPAKRAILVSLEHALKRATNPVGLSLIAVFFLTAAAYLVWLYVALPVFTEQPLPASEPAEIEAARRLPEKVQALRERNAKYTATSWQQYAPLFQGKPSPPAAP